MAADPLVGKVLADRFEILERIGEGGTGVVYKARQITVDRDIAIKVLGAHVSSDPQWVKRFHNEARAAAKLHHANTVQLIDFGQTKEGLLFIAMELLQGHSLRDEIDRVGKLQPARALRIIQQGAGSVGEAHSLGIIHRDIKPDNLYLVDMKGAGDFVKVLDFSVAKMDTGDTQQTRAGIVFGTPAYMSPEQGRGAKLGPQSDIYAFGIVLYEMLNGKPPFDSKIPTEVVMMHLREKPQPIAGIPDPLNALVLRTLDKDPSRRFQTCEELVEACDVVLQEVQPHTPSGMKAYGTGRPASVPMRRVAGAPAASMASQKSGAVAASQQAPRAVTAAPVEQKTMIADAPQPSRAAPGGMAGLGAPPPAAWPPSGGRAQGGVAPGGTAIIDPGQQAYRPPPAAGGNVPAGGGTVMLPGFEGVVSQAAQDRRANVAQQAQKAPSVKPAHWSFWAAWVLLGLGSGLALHFLHVHNQLAAAAGGG